MKTLFILIFIISYTQLYGCDCGKLLDLKASQERAISRSGKIIIGDVILSDQASGKFLIKVIEVLKGKVTSDTLVSSIRTTDCVVTPQVGRWIFYFDLNYETNFFICGMSRSFEHPEHIYIRAYLSALEEPTRKVNDRIYRDNYISKEEYKKEVEAIKITAKKDLQEEIVMLRARFSK